MKWLQHLRTINHHKWLVMKYCFRAELYKQGLLHDLSKYSFVEFIVGARYYQGNRSPNNAERENKGYSAAWLHHKGRNKHHLEYWIDYSLEKDKPMAGMKMPVKYVIEMFCDRIAASKTYNKEKYKDSDPLHYFEASKEHYLINEDTKKLIYDLLTMLQEKGENETFDYIKKNVLTGKIKY
ncbi:MAG: hypothetical protein K0S41_2735 [Anaerocolumna sp.]|jgi:hypothetical protein|nr:hypothetical protein [Anaerocolumna sp.]